MVQVAWSAYQLSSKVAVGPVGLLGQYYGWYGCMYLAVVQHVRG